MGTPVHCSMATVQGGVLYYINADHLGAPRSAVRASDNVEVWRWDSDPFGSDTATLMVASTPFKYNLRFPGQYLDEETSLHYNGMRDYDPYTGRYIQTDPLGLGGGLSRYAYVAGNPLSLVDPDGQFAFLAAPLIYEGVAFLIGVGTAWWISQQVKTPNSGPPGSWHTNPGSGQERLYGPNGQPQVDIDWDHDHGQGQPHPHNWGDSGREVPEGGFSPWPKGRGNPASCPKP